MNLPQPSEKERAAILNSLGAGVVPRIGLHHIQVGRKEEVAAILQDLKNIEAGGAAIRFVAGRYGSGKSFFLNLIRAVALERRFVVVQGDITTERRLQGTGGQPRALHAELMRNMATRSKPEGGALGNLVERWVGDAAHEVTAKGGQEADVERRIIEITKPLQDLVSGYDFAKVLFQYYRGHAAHDEALQTAAVRWLRAEYSTKTEARKDLGVRNIIDDHSFYDYLKLLAAFVRLAGYAGLLVLIDELVVLSHRLSHKQARDANYEAILRILNDCLQGSASGIGFVLAATDACLEDKRRGLWSYEALASRLAANRFATAGRADRTGPVLRLENLTPEDCYVLLVNIRRVHARGQDEAALLPDEAIRAYLEDCGRRLGAAYFQTPRDAVKDFVGLLGVLEQNPGTPWRHLLARVTTAAGDGRDPAEAAAAQEEAAAPPGGPGGAPGGGDDLASFRL